MTGVVINLTFIREQCNAISYAFGKIDLLKEEKAATEEESFTNNCPNRGIDLEEKDKGKKKTR